MKEKSLNLSILRRWFKIRKKITYNYVFLFYDINEKRVNKIFKICKKYLSHYQKSVFRGEISPSNIVKMKKELNKIIKPKEDFVSIIKLINEKYFSEDVLGEKTNTQDSLIL